MEGGGLINGTLWYYNYIHKMNTYKIDIHVHVKYMNIIASSACRCLLITVFLSVRKKKY